MTLIAAATKLKVALVTYPTTDQTIDGDRLSKETAPPSTGPWIAAGTAGTTPARVCRTAARIRMAAATTAG